MKAFLNFGILLICGALFIAVNYKVGGGTLVKSGFVLGSKFFLRILVLIIIFSVVSGQIEAYYKERPEAIKKALKSITKSALIGTTFPGGIAAGPILKKEWDEGGNKLAVIGFILATNLISWNTMLFRLPFFGKEITGWIYAIGFFITSLSVLVMILLHHYLEKH